MSGLPFRRVVIGMLVGDDARDTRVGSGNLLRRTRRQRGKMIAPRDAYLSRELDGRRNGLRVVEGDDREIDCAAALKGKRSAAVTAEPAPREIGADEILGRPA